MVNTNIEFIEKIEKIGSILRDNQQPLKKRFRALFTLRNLNGKKSIEIINDVLLNDASNLLKHECCYCLGQMNNQEAIKYLKEILNNTNENEIVRHEAAEALGNLFQNDDEIIKLLELYLKDKSSIVSQTCELSLNLIKWRKSTDIKEVLFLETLNPYQSKDPAPSFKLDKKLNEMKDILFDKNSKLFDKYRCLFTLRNKGKLEDIQLLGQSLVFYKNVDEMSLFKHEVGYIFGQMQSEDSISYLKEMVECKTENDIVRHECAEALGSIASIDTLDFLKNYLNDESLVVKESVEVALDMIDYETDCTQFNFI